MSEAFDKAQDKVQTGGIEDEGKRNEFGASIGARESLVDELMKQNNFREAEVVLRGILAEQLETQGLSDDHPDVLRTKSNLGAQLNNQNKCLEAEKLHREVLKSHQGSLGIDHPDSIIDMNNLAQVFMHQDRFKEAEDLQRQALELSQEHLGVDHEYTMLLTENLACTLALQSKFEEAEILHRIHFEKEQKSSGGKHGEMGTSMNNLAAALAGQSKFKEAEELYQQAIAISETDFKRGVTMSNLARVLKKQERYEESERLFRDAVEKLAKTCGKEDKRTQRSVREWIDVLQSDGKQQEAENVSQAMLVYSQS